MNRLVELVRQVTGVHLEDLAETIKDFLLDLDFADEHEAPAEWPVEMVDEARLPPPQGSWAAKYRLMIQEFENGRR